jgi:uncharacterized protein DUF4382
MRLTTALTIALGVSVVACGSPSGPSRSGNLRVMITDAPFDDASAVHVTFSEVKAHRAEDATDEWITVPFAGTPAATTRTCNLKKLEGPQDVLGVASLEAGSYTQLRLIVSSATIYFGGGSTGEAACLPTLTAPSGAGVTSYAMEIPSGEVKLNRQFELMSNGTTTIELDFDGARSISQTGNGGYRMTPVIAIKTVNNQ